jgi:hypothetical protein
LLMLYLNIRLQFLLPKKVITPENSVTNESMV